jgi:MFS transporter, FHS family, glucose/mannose:H+ symporter
VYDTSVNSPGSLALPGFFLSGFLLALLGAVLPAWGYHLDPEYSPAGNYFLCVAAGVILAGSLLPRIFPRVRLSLLLTVSCAIAWASLLFLALAGPPTPPVYRLAGWGTIGLAAGLLAASIFEAIRPVYQSDPAGTVNRGGIFFGMGCVAAALLLAGTFYLYSVNTILMISSILPGFFGVVYFRQIKTESSFVILAPTRAVFRDFLSSGAIMFALLLFFQSGNEWSVAGWLPIYLVRHLGMNPDRAVWTLVLYWTALVIGRIVAVYLLTRIRHSRLLFVSAGSALFGCILLMSTGNPFGATMGALFCGLGFASIYPLVLERIGHRFPYYHPGVFNSIFSIAIAGGMLAPGMIGWIADAWGPWAVMGLPVLGTLMVVVLLLLIWLESKVTGR